MTTESNVLRFTVRKGLAVHRKRLIRRNDGVKTTAQVQVDSFGEAFGNTAIELNRDEIPSYAHALEPVDEVGAAALELLQFKPPQREEEETYEGRLAKQIAAATIQSLITIGLLKPPRG